MKKWELIVLDMDGVLADFFGAALAIMNREYPDIVPWTRENWPKGEDGGIEPFYDVSPEEFWGHINGEPNFWYNLPMLPWAKELVRKVKERSERYVIMTSPSLDPQCFSQKYLWLRDKLKVSHFSIIVGGQKELLAGRNRLLIDDRQKTCGKFIEEGGSAALFPNEQNVNWRYLNDPMNWLDKVFEVYDKSEQLTDDFEETYKKLSDG